MHPFGRERAGSYVLWMFTKNRQRLFAGPGHESARTVAGGAVAYAAGGNPVVIGGETVPGFQWTAPVTTTTRD